MSSRANRVKRVAVGVLAFVTVIALGGAATSTISSEPRQLLGRVVRHVESRVVPSAGDMSDGGSDSSSTLPEQPALFPDAQVASVDPVVDGQAAAAHRLMSGWWTTHDTSEHDKKFLKWLAENAPQPPPPDVRNGELAQLHTLAAGRTPEGLSAAHWLDDNGKDVAWPALARQIADNPGAIHDGKVNDMLTMADDLVDGLKDKFGQQPPYVLDPSLSSGQKAKPKKHCVCSYPSGHATAAAAAATYLGAVDQTHAADYNHFRDQVDFSRMYSAGHLPSDIAAGTLLGDAIGEYFLVTRNGMAVPS